MKNKHNLTACVVKIASLCNLNCSYCYMYNKGDDSYKLQPKFLSHETILYFFDKLDKYLAGYEHESFGFVFHGGEPLLAKKELYEFFINQANLICTKHNKKPSFLIQTNGVLLNDEWISFLLKHNIYVGISMDGTKESNNRYRVYHNKKGAYDDILAGFNALKSRSKQVPGILSVIDLEQDPSQVYQHYVSIGAEYINLLFPDDTYDSNFIDDLKLGKWLLTFFKLWITNQDIKVDQFEVLLSIMYGADFLGNEYYGTSPNNTFILETDGEIQANDPLRVCMPNIHKTKLNVKYNDLMELTDNPLAELYYYAKQRLCQKCSGCELREICGGGYLINRYSSNNGFDNPSIYCKSLAYFITNVQNIVAEYTNPQMPDNDKIEKLNLTTILDYCNLNHYEASPNLTQFKKV